MTTDSSLALYRCPFCEKLSRSRDEILDHIDHSAEGRHDYYTASSLDRPIPELYPQVPEFPFGDWRDKLEDFARNHADEEGVVDHKAAGEVLEIPPAYAFFELGRMDNYHQRTFMGNQPSTSWEDLTDGQQSTLLARVYFPDKRQWELAGMDYVGVEGQSHVSHIVRNYLWILSHPAIDTPVYPNEKTDDRGELETVGDSDEMLANYEDQQVEAELEELEAEVIEEELEEAPEHEALMEALLEETKADWNAITSLYLDGYEIPEDYIDATMNELMEVDGVGEKIAESIKLYFGDAETEEEESEVVEAGEVEMEPAEDPSSPDEPRGLDAEDRVAALDQDQAFDAMIALAQTGQYEAARDIFNQVVEHGA